MALCGPEDVLDLAYKIFGGFRRFLPGVSQVVVLIRGLQDP